MAPPISNTSAEPTLYDILALTPKHLEGQAGAAQQHKIVKQAYHRALLKYHPDKAASGTSSSPSSSPSNTNSSNSNSKPATKHTPQSQSQPRITYTVDQIQHAYTVLSDRKQRQEYDRVLRTSPSHRQTQSASFQTGVETVDLDDLSWDSRTGVYYRGCRCGNARGYAFTEENLEEFEDDGVLMVECLDCSLWIRVLFAAADDEDEDVVVAATAPTSSSASGRVHEEVAIPRGEGGPDGTVTAAGERRGSGTRRGFTFNWSFNWGISLSGSATAGAGTSGSRR
ncbi:hypothetical protein F5Y13DRAFT_173892 [Hypoxylon sp. FL1857]|nr:hypothetical protein F5Y13DRAFT_173892 [Hypoxylon sp. FL1857]